MKATLTFTGLLALTASCAQGPDSPRASALGAAGVGNKKFTDAEFSCYEASAALALAAGTAPSYNGSVKALVDSACAGCHSAKGIPPDLSTYAAVVNEGEASLNLIKAGKMPTAGPLPVAQQELFAQWVEGGMLEADAAPPTPSSGDAVPVVADTLKAICKSSTAATPTTGVGSGDAVVASGSGSGEAASGSDTPTGSGTGSETGTGTEVASGSDAVAVPGSGTASASGSDAPPRKVNYVADLKPLLDSQCVNCHAAGKQVPDLSSYATAKAGGVRGLVRVTEGTMPTAAAGGALSDDEVALFKAWSDAGFPEKDTP